MSRTVSVIAVFTSIVSALAAFGAAPTGLTYPDTAPGRHVAAFFAAYNSGSEDAMKKFYEQHVSTEALKTRSVAERLTVYHGMREEQGALTPLKVTASDDASVTLLVRNQQGETLSMTFLCEENPPHGMVGIRIMDQPGDPGPEEVKPGEAEARPKTDARLVSVLRSHLDALVKDDAFSGAVLVAKGGKPLFREAYGFASRDARVPNRPDTKFNLGSINKAFTRIAIEQLAAEGKLKTSDTIDRYVPEYPSGNGGRITIQQLLDHRGGVPDIFGPAYDAADRTGLREIKDWIPLFAQEPLRFDPGTREEYSNGGYVLLGRVIESVSKQRYYDYVREKIFKPAGMASTDSYAQDEAVANRAIPYTRRFAGGKSEWSDARKGNPARGSSAGGGYSTVDDLLRFDAALRAHTFGAGGGRAGLGIAGGSPGTNALLESLGDYTIVVLANMDPPAAERLGVKIRAWLPRPGASPDVAVERETPAPVPERR